MILHSIYLVNHTGVCGGTNIILENAVTIGTEKDRAPVLGNNAYIGSVDRIIGRITVGNNVRIRANTVVLKDALDHAMVVGISACVVRIGDEKVDAPSE